MKEINILFMASSKKIGLTFNFTRLAVALNKIHNIIVISGKKEEEEGLFEELSINNIKNYKIDNFDNCSILNFFSIAKIIGKIVDNNDIKIIHAQGIQQMLIGFFVTKFLNKKEKICIVSNVHSILHGNPFENIALFIESYLLNICVDAALPVANFVAKKLINICLSSNKTFVVHNGIDLQYFDNCLSKNEIHSSNAISFLKKFPINDYIVIGYVANMIPRKGHVYLIKSFLKIVKDHPNLILLLIGDGPLRKELDSYVDNIGISKNVHFTGRISYKELYIIIKSIDIYAFPSLSELFPFAILEAMVAAKPVVATNVGGVPEAVIHGVNGYLIQPKDTNSMSKLLLKLIEKPDIAKKMGIKGRKMVENNFSMCPIVHKLSHTYKLVLKKNE
jgi:glycosyltransferase involved in cell wall biosynthesis